MTYAIEGNNVYSGAQWYYDLPDEIIDALRAQQPPEPVTWTCDHGCKGITAEFVAVIHVETHRTHKVTGPASTTGSERADGA